MKKGQMLLPPFLVLIGLIVLVLAFVGLNSKVSKLNDRVIGNKQTEIMKTYQKAEEILFYLDVAGKYAAEEAYYDIMSGGGYFSGSGEYLTTSGCGSDSGVVLWENKGKKCVPGKKDLLSAFALKFNEKLRAYSSLYPEYEKQISMPFSYSAFESESGLIMKSADFLVIGRYVSEKKIKPFSGKTVKLSPCDFAGIDADGNYNTIIGERTATRADSSFSEAKLVRYKGFFMHEATKECAEKFDRLVDGKLVITSAYRPGSSGSFHSLGQAIDFWVDGMTSSQIAEKAQQAGCFTWVYNEEIACHENWGGPHIHASVGVK